MKKHILILFFWGNLLSFCQVGKWTYIDTFTFRYPYRTLISCNNNNCVVASSYNDSANKKKFCLNLYHSQITLTDWQLSGIDCSRLIFDSIKQEYYQYEPPMIKRIKTLSNQNQLFITYDNKLFLSMGKSGKYKLVNCDTFLNNKTNYEENGINLINSNKTCYIFFDKPWKGLNPTSKRIYVSDDYGETWEEIHFNNKELKLKAIFYLSAPTDNDLFMLTLYDSLDKNILYHSSDKGRNWEEVNYPFDTMQNIRVTSHFFESEKIGWISCELADNNITKGIIYKTNDGCKSWFKQYEFDNWLIQNIVFIDEYNGYILDNLKGFFTSDGGDNWITLYDYSDNQLNTKPAGLSRFEILDNNSFLAYNNVLVYLYEINPTKIFENNANPNLLKIELLDDNFNNKVAFHISSSLKHEINIRLFNLYGNLLEYKRFSEYIEDETYELDVSNYPQGIYFIYCAVGGVTEVKKICIIR